MKWQKVGLELTEVPQGLLVRQEMGGQSRVYIARGFRLTADVIEFVERCMAYGLVCAIQKGHPRKGNLGEDGEGADYLSFSTKHEELWICCVDSWSFRGNKANGLFINVGIQKRFALDLNKNNISYRRETYGGKNCRIASTDLGIALSAITGKIITPSNQFQTFDAQVLASMKDAAGVRAKRLALASRIPERVEVSRIEFQRNPDVVAEVLVQANGRCAGCNLPAPFDRRADGSPYLEVHHKIPLAEGGEDTVENAVALCPNCHRKAHYG
jgi:hypothetical protein